MKRAVSISLGSSRRNKRVTINFASQTIELERIGTDGDADRAKVLFTELDGQVDCLSVGGVDLYLRLEDREYPLHAALKLVENVKQTPVVDGRGLKHTLERRVFELASADAEFTSRRYQNAFVPVAVDRLGLAKAAAEISQAIVIGDLMIALGVPIPVRGIRAYKRLARVMLPIVSHFPLSMLFYGSGGVVPDPRYERYFLQADLIAGDFMFMKKYLPLNLHGKTVVTNTTTPKNIELLRTRGVHTLITTTPRYEGRTFGTNMLEAALTAYAGYGRLLTDPELNRLIDDLALRPTTLLLNEAMVLGKA